VNPKDGLPYVWIPPGKFMMGCSPGDNECGPEEKPAHEVEIRHGFWLGQTSVTVGAWKRYRAVTGNPALPTSDRWGRTNLNEASGDDNMPVVMVTWEEARGFCEWSEGRLPTGAEWEYAARAGTTGVRYGSLDAIAWYADNSGRRRIDSEKMWAKPPYLLRQDGDDRLFRNGNGPHPVGQKQPNAWNLYDMLGNVWQWMADPAVSQMRHLCGGSWSYWPGAVRVSSGNGAFHSTRSSSFGVRCAGN
jgi:formylglycine-generating enzyme required for sulfatase activity